MKKIIYLLIIFSLTSCLHESNKVEEVYIKKYKVLKYKKEDKRESAFGTRIIYRLAFEDCTDEVVSFGIFHCLTVEDTVTLIRGKNQGDVALKSICDEN